MSLRETQTKLVKLIPLLGSDKDGEVVAAARAIVRTLDAVGGDLHSLAAVIAGRPWTPAGGRTGEAGHFNYAEIYHDASPVGADPTHPDAMSPRLGFQIDGTNWLGSWREVAIHCLKLNREVKRAHGGRFLRKHETGLLDLIRDGKRWPTNAQVFWIETVLARCHQAQAAERRSRSA